MKVYSWNMLFKNAQQDRALAFIQESDFGVFCLQEVPRDFLDRLIALFPHISYAVETSRTYKGVVDTHYLVTLSRNPISETVPLPIVPRASRAPARANHFSGLMFTLRLWAKGHGPRNNLLTRIKTPDGTVAVYNLHLPLKHPQWRREEFEATLSGRDKALPTIICGDFNILESPHITALNWLLGGTFTDAFLYTRERTEIQKRFAAHELQNPLRGKSTHPLSYSQLDHILVSRVFQVQNAAVSRDRYGSDHAPIWAELA